MRKRKTVNLLEGTENHMSQGQTDLATIEYQEVGENMRHWGNMRFVSMTVFIGIMAGLLSAFFQWGGSMSHVSYTLLRIGGAIASVLFLIMDIRFLEYWRKCRERGITLEIECGFKQYRNFPKQGFVSSSNAVKALYILFLAFWSATLLLYMFF